jgi:hypothetical protein
MVKLVTAETARHMVVGRHGESSRRQHFLEKPMNILSSTTRILLIAAITLLSAGLALRGHFGRSHINPAATDFSAPMPSLEADKAIEHLKQRGLYDSLAQAVSDTRYQVSFDRRSPDSTPTYRGPNPAQGYDAYFTPNRLCIGDAKASQEWQLSMKLIGYGYGEKLLSVSPGELKAERNRIEIDKSIIKEWYVNRAEGLEQGFTITEPLAGKDENARLRLRLKVSGKLSPRLVREGDVIEFITPEGEAVLRYGGLYAYDAKGQSLLSAMAVAGDEIWLEVDDRGADYPLTIDPTFKQQAKLTVSDDSPANDQFGGTVAISGDTAIVVAPFGDPTFANAGTAYVFVRTGTTWSQQAELFASDGASFEGFGSSVAISGETVLIGDPGDDAPAIDSGSVYVFERSGTTWSEQTKLTASDGAVGDFFGSSVAISGETAIVGAPGDDAPANNSGSAYVFVRTGSIWTEQAKLTASDGAAGDQFGTSVAISGETVAVGAFEDDIGSSNEGSAYVFVRSGTTWSQQQKLTALDGMVNDAFGMSVAISGETVIVGAIDGDAPSAPDSGSAYVFVRTGSTWSQQAKLTASDAATGDEFSISVAISGETVVVGARMGDAPGAPNSGSAYVFMRSGATWSQQTELTASDAAADDRFGSSVAISGETAIIGAPEDDAPANNSGSAYVFICSAPTEVRLSSFAATAYDQGVHLQWSTGFEVDNLGFRLYHDQAGKLSPVNPQLIAGSALLAGSSTVLSAGQTYSWWDKSVAGRKDLQYWLEDVDLNGKSTWHGPFLVTPVGGHRPEIRQAALLPLMGYSQSSITTVPSRNASPQASSQLKPDQGLGLAALPAVKIAVRTEGWYRASQPEIFAAGLDPQANPQFLQLFVDGRELPISVTGEQDGRFDSGDTIEFYATGLDAPWTDTRVYWLVAGSRPGLRIAAGTSGKVGKLLPASFTYTVERRDRSIYFASLQNGEKENFFGAVITTTPLDQSLTLRHLDAATPQEAIVEVSLQGVTLTSHKVRVSLNGISIGEVSFTDQARGAVRLSVSRKLLVEGNNQVSLTALGGSNDVSLVDNIRLTYQRRFMAEGNSLRFMASSDQQVTVDGFTNDRIRIVDVTNPDSVQEVRGTVRQQKDGYSVTTTISGPGQRMLLAFTSEQARRPVSITANLPSSLRQPSNGADLIIITRREFANSLQPLVRLRQSQGLAVEVIDVEDIYDEFNNGHKSPQALKEFLSYAATSWKRKPGYVLLAADASLDPKGYLGLGEFDLVPSKLIDTQYLETVSDDWLADFDGDGLAEIAVGRLPFRTVQESTRMVAKIVGYEQISPADSLLLASDSNDGYNFEMASEQLRSLVPQSVRVEEVRREELKDEAAKGALLEAINRGQKIINYTGHGSVSLWRGNLLTSDDARALKNKDHPALFVMMTCLNGYFQDASLDSLAESLLKAERGGAVAVWASSAMTEPNGQAAINQELYRLVFTPGGQSLRLGDAIRRAKAVVGDGDVRHSWILFGDPTMRLK